MPARKKQKKAAPAAAAPTQKDYKAEKLTGGRAQRGMLPNGRPRYVYEVKWHGHPASKNTYEPACNLVGWEEEMAAVDDKYSLLMQQSPVNFAGAAIAAREAAAKQKAAELKERRDRLDRLKRRRAERNGDEDDEEDCDDEEEVEEDAETRMLDDEQLARELLLAEQLLARAVGANTSGAGTGTTANATATEGAATQRRTIAAADAAPSKMQHTRPGSSRVWKAFNRSTNRCMLPHKNDPTRQCGAMPCKGTGTSGHIRH